MLLGGFPIPGPMLATSGRPSGSLAGWTAEYKADGFRCQATMLAGRRVLKTRGGQDIADRVPELEPLSQLGVDVVLDGELVAGARRPSDFYDVVGAVSARRGTRRA
jgi:bifunctional non-homologous end joining protein LigD